MKKHKKNVVLKELFINDFLIGTCFWSLMLLLVLPFVRLPQSLAMTLYLFFGAVSVLCLPFALYKIGTACHLAHQGVAITATNISIEHGAFGSRLTFDYVYDGHTYHKVKFFASLFLPEKAPLTLLVDTRNPTRYIIVACKKKSIFSLVRERNRK
jgi:hypothetical protein